MTSSSFLRNLGRRQPDMSPCPGIDSGARSMGDDCGMLTHEFLRTLAARRAFLHLRLRNATVHEQLTYGIGAGFRKGLFNPLRRILFKDLGQVVDDPAGASAPTLAVSYSK